MNPSKKKSSHSSKPTLYELSLGRKDSLLKAKSIGFSNKENIAKLINTTYVNSNVSGGTNGNYTSSKSSTNTISTENTIASTLESTSMETVNSFFNKDFNTISSNKLSSDTKGSNSKIILKASSVEHDSYDILETLEVNDSSVSKVVSINAIF